MYDVAGGQRISEYRSVNRTMCPTEDYVIHNSGIQGTFLHSTLLYAYVLYIYEVSI